MGKAVLWGTLLPVRCNPVGGRNAGWGTLLADATQQQLQGRDF